MCDGTYAKPYSNIAYFLAHLHHEHKISEQLEAEIEIKLMKGEHYFVDGLLMSDNTTYYFKVDKTTTPKIDPIIFRAFERVSATVTI